MFACCVVALRLKLAQTKLLHLVNLDDGVDAAEHAHIGPADDAAPADGADEAQSDSDLEMETDGAEADADRSPPRASAAAAMPLGSEVTELLRLVSAPGDLRERERGNDDARKALGSAGGQQGFAGDQQVQGQFSAYSSELDFLEDKFELLLLTMKASKESNKQLIKDKQASDEADHFESSKGKKVNVAELHAKLRMQEARINYRLEATKGSGAKMPRLETLSNKMSLDDFEKSLLLLLVGSIISPVIRQMVCSFSARGGFPDEALTVGKCLQVLAGGFREQVLSPPTPPERKPTRAQSLDPICRTHV
jgi:hypothetical protein